MARTISDNTREFDSEGSLMIATKKLLEGKDFLTIYVAYGIPYHWLIGFASGRYANPSVNRVQFLYEKLSGKKIILKG